MDTIHKKVISFSPIYEEGEKLSAIWRTKLNENAFDELNRLQLPSFLDLDVNISFASISYLRARGFNFNGLNERKYANLLFNLFKENVTTCEYLYLLVKKDGNKVNRYFMSKVVQELPTLTDEQIIFIINNIVLRYSILLYLYDIPACFKDHLDAKLIKTYIVAEAGSKNENFIEPFFYFLSDKYFDCLRSLYPTRRYEMIPPKLKDYLYLLYGSGKRTKIYFELSFGKFFKERLNIEDIVFDDAEEDAMLHKNETDLFSELTLLDEDDGLC